MESLQERELSPGALVPYMDCKSLDSAEFLRFLAEALRTLEWVKVAGRLEAIADEYAQMEGALDKDAMCF